MEILFGSGLEKLQKLPQRLSIQFGHNFAYAKKIELEMLNQGVNSQKDLPLVDRLNIITPYFEKTKAMNDGKIMPVGGDLIFLGNLLEWFGKDTLAALIEKDLVEPKFDYTDRKESGLSLPDFLRSMAKEEGWKE